MPPGSGSGSAGDPHADGALERSGEPLEAADAVAVLLHGRGATARGILGLATEFDRDGVAYLAPQAARNTWYPNPFTAPVEANEPGRTSGLAAIGRAIDEAAAAGIPTSRVLVLGFSQGACLASEFVARRPRRYGGLAALSGGLIGESIDPADYDGDLDGTPAFLGCSDTDPHIPASRVRETAEVLDALGADVTTRLYGDLGHGVNADEVSRIAAMLDELVTRS